ncbi:hypothetical protein DRE_06481 [Drechslerella stenobrocha 248]|uniref:DUF6314 domain-containing protein n=1 Tax=Drechslerella stenobrocha 248 TaxID=1043628 RepID=W7HXQ7_9PEZI|nr:hypothetical protein DRE_06481 [Drechslerella stenobrocha 248]
MAKTVCIIGAGPAGLVAAKTLLHDAPGGDSFKVTVFEAQSRIGGLWPSSREDDGGLVHPTMIVNQSRHTMHFSDFSWSPDSAQFPRAWRIGDYLERYRQRYCNNANLRLGCRVIKADLVPPSADNSDHSWHVQTQSTDGGTEEHTFDYVLIASGFFGQPHIPAAAKDRNLDIPAVHSGQYRTLEGLLGDPKVKSGKILVVGGQLSGVEIAGTIASDISSAVNSPGPRRNDFIDQATGKSKFSVHHLTQRPTWVVPLMTPVNPAPPAPYFHPLDLGQQSLERRPPGPLKNTQGHIDVAAARRSHEVFRELLRTDQSMFSPLLAIPPDVEQQPFLAFSDTYMELVRAGNITISCGRLDSLSGSVATTSTSEHIEDIAAVVLATGFKAACSLSFLSEDIKNTLSLSPEDLNHTVALAFHNTHHPAVPNLGFVGFYRSPYWGAMEMQARFLTALWSAGGPSSSTLPPSITEALKSDDSIARSLALRGDPRASQFPMGDYAWLMQEFAKALDLDRIPHTVQMPHRSTGPESTGEMNILTTARYPARNIDAARMAEVQLSLSNMQATALECTRGRFVSRAIFRSLLGKWNLQRTHVSRHGEQPSGRFTGTAQFLLREGTAHGREEEFAKLKEESGDPGFEYLYVEEGEFVDDTKNLRFNATRRYIWRYVEQDDTLSVWFVKTDDDRTADYLFHNIELVEPDQDNGTGWPAKGGHMCIKDFYDVRYKFTFQSVNLQQWSLSYNVSGPKKGYTLNGQYTR